jgi:hypothetical protein
MQVPVFPYNRSDAKLGESYLLDFPDYFSSVLPGGTAKSLAQGKFGWISVKNCLEPAG